MNFDLSEEQRLLKDSVDGVVRDAYGDFEKRCLYQATASGWSAELWGRYADLGLLALPFSEADGGMGMGPVETMLVMEAMGRGLVVEPYLATIVLGGGLLRHGSAAQRQRYIPQIAAGSLRVAFAHTEVQARYDLGNVGTQARKQGTAYLLDGAKCAVLHGDSAELLIVSARGATGVSLFLVEGTAAQRRGYATHDGLRAADMTFIATPAELLIDHALPFIERVVDEGIAAIAAEAVGAMEALVSLTVEYLKMRKQFGVALSSFQALQHRSADMLVALEQARSMAMYGAMMSQEPDAHVRRTALSQVKVQINESARAIGQEAIQLHGGIGMTWEYKGGHYFKRLTLLQSLFGDTDHHLDLLSAAPEQS